MTELNLNGKRVLCEVVPKGAHEFRYWKLNKKTWRIIFEAGFETHFRDIATNTIFSVTNIEFISEEQILKLSTHLITSKAKSEIEFFIEESGITWTESETILIVEIK